MVEENGRVFIIAEAGVNHNGDVGMAHRLIDAASLAGADAVKFQTYSTELLVNPTAETAPYQRTADCGTSQARMLRDLELPPTAYAELAAHCADSSIEFMSTPFHAEAADLLAPLVRRFKTSSGDLTDLDFLRHVSRLGKPMIVSTGMSSDDEVRLAVDAIRPSGVHLTLLHCTSLYPAPFESVNLRAMVHLRTAFGVPSGYSDHTSGISVATAAAALGATVIEKHFTLDRTLPGPDHAASLQPAELRTMVEFIRQVEASLGDGAKRPMPGEDATQRAARKSLVANRHLKAGTVLEKDMLSAKRPGTGIPPSELARVLGRRLSRDVQADELLGWESMR